MVGVGSDLASNAQVLALAEKYPSFVYPALGLHPWELARASLPQVLAWVEENLGRGLGVGEIGLDYDRRVLKQVGPEAQQAAFRQFLALAQKHRKPALVHCRFAWKDCLRLVREAGIERALFHWFAGPPPVLEEVLSLGHFISATPAAEYQPDHRRALALAPLDRVLLETDAPVEYGRGERYQARLAHLVRSLNALAEIKGLPPQEIAQTTTDNARRFFGLL